VGHDVRVVEVHVGGFDDQPPPSAHGVPPVDRQVHHDLFDLCRIRFHEVKPFHEASSDLHVLADESAQHALHLGHYGIQVNRPGLEGVLPAEREELAGQARPTVGSAQDGIEAGLARRVAAEIFHQQVAVALDHGKEVVEVVGDASRQLADRLQLLCPLEARLCYSPGLPLLGSAEGTRDGGPQTRQAALRHEVERAETHGLQGFFFPDLAGDDEEGDLDSSVTTEGESV
jgi:hypothetical protein